MASIIRTEDSYKKHAWLKIAIESQLAMYRIRHRRDRIVIVDMHAGDGQGVLRPQPALFPEYTEESESTAALAVRHAEQYRADVILCEKQAARRQSLQRLFPHVRIEKEHAVLLSLLEQGRYDWGLILNDPNGVRDQGVDIMQTLAGLLRCDFIMTFNEGAWHCHMSVRDTAPSPAAPERKQTTGCRESKARYQWMHCWDEWPRRLARKHIAYSVPMIKQSSRFHFHILVVADFLGDRVRHKPFEVYHYGSRTYSPQCSPSASRESALWTTAGRGGPDRSAAHARGRL